MKVFIENEAGKNQKNIYNEKTGDYIRTVTVSREYPFPYGFVLNTTNEDGDNLDCYIITKTPLKRGDIIICEPIGMMEQIEDNEEDHNILAVLPNETISINASIKNSLAEFVMHVFDHIKGKKIKVGRFLGRQEAEKYIVKCRDEKVEDVFVEHGYSADPANKR